MTFGKLNSEEKVACSQMQLKLFSLPLNSSFSHLGQGKKKHTVQGKHADGIREGNNIIMHVFTNNNNRGPSIIWQTENSEAEITISKTNTL